MVDATNHGHTGSEKYKWCPNFKATQGIYNKLVVKFGEGGGGVGPKGFRIDSQRALGQGCAKK